MTVRDLITKALKSVHIIGAGEALDSEEMTDAFDELNGIIEQANLEKLFGYYETTLSFPTVNGKIAYTVGPASTTPDVTATRPVEILSGYTRRGTVDYPLGVRAKRDYDDLTLKNIGVGSWVQILWYQAAWPKGTFTIWPKPVDALTTVFLSVMAEVAAFASIDDAVDLPPGYRTWMQLKLAKRVAPGYGMQFSEQMEANLTDIEQAVKSNNIKPMPVANTGLVSLAKGSGGRYDVSTDSMR